MPIGTSSPITLNNFEFKTLGEYSTATQADRPYIIVNFGAGENMYYALDVVITTDKPAKFTMTVSGSAINTHNTFAPGSGEPNTFYLGGMINGVDFWDPRPNSKMTSSYAKDDGYVDAYIEMDITAGSQIKMYYLDDSGKRGSTNYYVAKNLIKVPQTINANISGGEANCNIYTTGKYRIRYYGETSVMNAANQYVEYLELTLLNDATLDVDVDEGYYAIGEFSDEKILAEYKMTACADHEGIYELALENASGQSFYVAHVDENKKVEYSSLAVADIGSTVLYYDAYNNTALKHAFDGIRVSIDISNVGAFAAAGITFTYRSEITSTETASVSVKEATHADGIVFADIAQTEIASAGVNIVYGSKRADSFDINKHTLGTDGYFTDGKSFRITANSPTDDGNWSGSIAKFSNGSIGNSSTFDMSDDGYALILENGNAASVSASKEFGFTVEQNGGDIAANVKFMIYRNGKAVSGLSEANARVNYHDGTYLYSIIDGAKSYGEYSITLDTNVPSIRFLGNISALGSIVGGYDDNGKWVNTNASLEGYYIVGQFTDWKVYENNRMSETSNIIGYHTKTIDDKYVITQADIGDGVYAQPDEYKIVYVPADGEFVWYDNNQTVKSNTFYFDAFGKTYDAIDTNSIIRIVFDYAKLPIECTGYTFPKLHYWLDTDNTTIATVWSGTATDTRPDMIKVNENLYYWDIPYSRVNDDRCKGDGEGLTGIVIQTTTGKQSVDISFEPCNKGTTYTVTPTGTVANNKWNCTLSNNA